MAGARGLSTSQDPDGLGDLRPGPPAGPEDLPVDGGDATAVGTDFQPDHGFSELAEDDGVGRREWGVQVPRTDDPLMIGGHKSAPVGAKRPVPAQSGRGVMGNPAKDDGRRDGRVDLPHPDDPVFATGRQTLTVGAEY